MPTVKLPTLGPILVVMLALWFPISSNAQGEIGWTENILNRAPLLESRYREVDDDHWYVGCVVWPSGHVVTYLHDKTGDQSLKQDGRVIGQIDRFVMVALHELIQAAAERQGPDDTVDANKSASFSLFAWLPADDAIPPTMKAALLQQSGKAEFRNKSRPALQLVEWWSDLIVGTDCPGPGLMMKEGWGLDKHLLKGPFEAFSGTRASDGDDLYGYRSANGTVVLEPQFVLASDFLETGIAAVVDQSGWAYIDRFGRVLVRDPFLFDNGPDEFSDGLARYWDGQNIGFFDRQGKIRIKANPSFKRPFTEGYAAFCHGCSLETDGEHSRWTGGKWGYITTTGAVVLPAEFDAVSPFKNGVARIERDGVEMIIDLNKRIFPPEWGVTLRTRQMICRASVGCSKRYGSP